MDFSNRVSQTLHDEHRASVALMERLEHLIARSRRIPDTSDTAVRQLLLELSVAVETEIDRHFGFEENELFGFLDAAGDHAIGAHLTDEHMAIRPLGVRLAALARAAADHGFDTAGWEEFARVGRELSERMLAHIQKEEMALLPLLEETMDSEAEARLYELYTDNV